MKRNRLMVSAVLLLAVGLVLSGCGGGGPTGTVKAWFNAMNAGKYSEAVEYLGSGLAELGKIDGGKSMSDDFTNSGTMTKLEVISEEVRGEGATVKVRVHFKDGGVEDQTISLVKQDGDWKITM
jgi:hypothetical protein